MGEDKRKNQYVELLERKTTDFRMKTPELLVYALVQILEMTVEQMNQMLAEAGICESEKFYVACERIKENLEKKNLNLALILECGKWILPYCEDTFAKNPSRRGAFRMKFWELSQEASFVEVTACLLSFLSDEFLDAYDVHSTSEQVRKLLFELTCDDEKLLERTEQYAGIVLGEFQYEIALKKIGKSFQRQNLDAKQADGLLEKLKLLTDKLMEQENLEAVERLLKEFSKQLRNMPEWEALTEAYDNLGYNSTNDKIAIYKAAGHKAVRKVWEYLENCKLTYLEQESMTNPLLYLSKKYAEVYSKLTNKVIGQDYAVNEFVQACFDAELYNKDENRPQAVFLFAGPPGVGKTFLAKNVAELLGRPFKVFDMSTYATEKSDLILTGVEQAFRNAVEGTLVGFVEDNPNAVLLFDEIEKAHPDVIKLFLSVLDGARLENKFLTSVTDFSETMIIFTTNAGKSIYADRKSNLSAIPPEVIIKELQKEKSSDNTLKFPPEICSRFASQHIVMFNHIGISDMVKLIQRKMDETCAEIGEKLQVKVAYDQRMALLLLMHYGKIDVRVVTGKAEQFIRREIYELSRQLTRIGNAPKINSIYLSVDDKRITKKAKNFFKFSSEGCIGVVCDESVRERFAPVNTMKIIFFDSVEKMMEHELSELDAIFVDPYFKMRQVDHRILGLDDYESIGLKIIKTLIQRQTHAPVYLLEAGKRVTPVDRNTFYMRGVEDTVSLDTESIKELFEEIVMKHSMQKKCDKMLARRKVFDFESLQEAPDENGHVVIRFYDIVVKDSVDAEDKNLLMNIEERPNVKFDDIIGAENAKAELRDFIRYLENPNSYMKSALVVPKGILLYGPPGTGKTMLAKAMAGETDATFISVSATELRMGTGEYKVKKLFETARKYAPAIIFIDEVDAIAKKRSGGVLSSSAEESLLNMFLTEMDGFEKHDASPVFVIAATNFGVEESANPLVGSLDPSFMRRFGNKILVDPPNKDERMLFLQKKLHGKGKKILPNAVTKVGIRNLAERTVGHTLAELENILQLAFRNAFRQGELLNNQLLEAAMEEYFYGEEHTRNEQQLYKTAIHEASHAYIYWLSGKKPAYLSIISRGSFGGYMQKESNEHKVTWSKTEFLWSIRTSLAGRIGELHVFGEEEALNTGASSDLRQASEIALAMLTSYGMYEGHLFTIPYEMLVNSPMMPVYAEQAEKILQEEAAECRRLIAEGEEKILKMAKELVEQGHLNQEEIEALFQ